MKNSQLGRPRREPKMLFYDFGFTKTSILVNPRVNFPRLGSLYSPVLFDN